MISIENIDLLGKTVLFKGCTREELEVSAGMFQERQMKANTIIFTEQMAGEALYIVKSGSVKISVMAGEGFQLDLLSLGAGEFFGELSLINEVSRQVTARAEAPTELLVLSRKDFKALSDLDPKTGARIVTAIARLLAMRVHAYKHRLKELLMT